MNAQDDKLSTDKPNRERAAGWRLLGKWLLISVVVLFLLVLIENLWVQFNEEKKPVEQAASLNEAVQPVELRSSDIGKSFDSFAAFIHFQQSLGFVFLGRFEDHWPAEIREERTGMNEISFVRSDGTKHHYPNLDGYQLKLVRLRTQQGTEAIVVLKSREKR